MLYGVLGEINETVYEKHHVCSSGDIQEVMAVSII